MPLQIRTVVQNLCLIVTSLIIQYFVIDTYLLFFILLSLDIHLYHHPPQTALSWVSQGSHNKPGRYWWWGLGWVWGQILLLIHCMFVFLGLSAALENCLTGARKGRKHDKMTPNGPELCLQSISKGNPNVFIILRLSIKTPHSNIQQIWCK